MYIRTPKRVIIITVVHVHETYRTTIIIMIC